MSSKKKSNQNSSKENEYKKSDPNEDNAQSSLTVENQNFARTLSKKNAEISILKKRIKENLQYNAQMQSELFTLKKFYSDSSKLRRELDVANEKNQQLEFEIENLNKKILDQHKNFSDTQRIMEKKHLTEISKLKVTIDSYIQKTLRSNMNELDNEKLTMQVKELKKENKDIIDKTKQQIIQKEIQNKLKFTKLKDKMLENINETKEEVTELNMKYMDISTKLTLLQNHQLLVQLDYQTQQLEESTKKNEIYKKKIADLTKDIELHKEVEVSFAEKNKKLARELMKYKKEGGDDNNYNSKELKDSEVNSVQGNNSSINNPQQIPKVFLYTNNSFNNNNKYGKENTSPEYTRILALEKKVLNLEKKLEQKKREYNDLKEKNEHIENMLKNKDRKYSGLYNFLEESLNNFFNDEQIINNRDIYINTEALKRFEFSQLSKEQKYSTLIVLMKYLIPLIYNEKEVLKPYNNNLDKFNVQYHIPKENTLIINDKFRKFLNIRQRNKNSAMSSDNIRKINNLKNNSENLPSISRGVSFIKNNAKLPTSSSILSGKGNQSINPQ
jgi:hypothetical protein